MAIPQTWDLSHLAFFLDFDGTLAEIASRPDAVHVDPKTLATLERLVRRLGGALAIISGRALEEIDRYFDPLVLPCAGIHGTVRRDAQGGIRQRTIDAEIYATIVERIDETLGGEAGLIIERKPGAVAVHYRSRPELEGKCLALMRSLVDGDTGLHLQPGKMVFEILANGINKGDAISQFMAEAPFKGRRPLFAGDDRTDEAGFNVVNASQGISIKVGEGETVAQYHAESTKAFLDWLNAIGASGTNGAVA